PKCPAWTSDWPGAVTPYFPRPRRRIATSYALPWRALVRHVLLSASTTDNDRTRPSKSEISAPAYFDLTPSGRPRQAWSDHGGRRNESEGPNGRRQGRSAECRPPTQPAMFPRKVGGISGRTLSPRPTSRSILSFPGATTST